jgi:hypothetical protein
MLMRLACLLWLVLCAVSIVVAQAEQPAHPVEPTRANQPSSPSTPESEKTSSSAADSLRAQNDLLWKFDTRLMTITFWALGIVAAISVLGWYANFRLSQREINAVRIELVGEMQNQLSKAKEELARLHQAQLAELLAKHKETADWLRTQSSQFTDELTKMAFSIKGDLTKEFSSVAADFYAREAERCEDDKSWLAAFSANLKRMEYLMKQGMNESAGNMLGDLYRSLKEANKIMRVPPWERDKLRLFLSELPAQFSKERDKVLEEFRVIKAE